MCISMIKKICIFDLFWLQKKPDSIMWIKNGESYNTINSYCLHSGIVSPDPIAMKLSNKSNNLASSDCCLMDSISIKIINILINQNKVKYTITWTLVVIRKKKLPRSCSKTIKCRTINRYLYTWVILVECINKSFGCFLIGICFA